MVCLVWALEEPEAAGGLLRAASFHAALARDVKQQDLDDRRPVLEQAVVRTSLGGWRGNDVKGLG
jgi:hypothetical protein